MFTVLAVPEAPAQRFVEVAAEIDLISYQARDPGGASVEQHRTYPATCIVGTDEWRIDTEFLLNAKQAWYFDGTNVYCSTRITKDVPLSIPARPGLPAFLPFSQAKSNITVTIVPSQGGHPLGNLGVNIPWLAFCSASYLKREGRALPLPTALVHKEPESFGYTDKVQIFGDDLGLPEVVRLFTSRAKYSEALRHAGGSPEVERARMIVTKSTAQDGRLKFEYVADESTNFSGWTLPVKFHYVTYERDAEGAWRPFVGGNGRVVSLREAGRPGNVFLPGGNESIVDYRFESAKRPVDAILYRAAGSMGAPPTNDPALQRNYAETLKRATRHAPVSTSLFRWVLIFVVCLPIVVTIAVRLIARFRMKE